jgi:hypothetical protein
MKSARVSAWAVLLLAAPLDLVLGCGGEPASDPALPLAQAAVEVSAAAPPTAPGCTFSRGVTTCITITQHEEQSTHTEVSGCAFGPTIPPIPGRRTRTFLDLFLVTETTTTLQHGRAGKVFDTQTTTERQLLSSTLLSDVCEPL